MKSANKPASSSAAPRNTIQRALVLDAVRSSPDHPTSAEIYDRVREEHENISRATVYRNLDVLVQNGMIGRIEIPNGAACYDVSNKPHYHVKCKGCKGVFDVDMPYLADLPTQISDFHGFRIDGHQIMFEGICPDCVEG